MYNVASRCSLTSLTSLIRPPFSFRHMQQPMQHANLHRGSSGGSPRSKRVKSVGEDAGDNDRAGDGGTAGSVQRTMTAASASASARPGWRPEAPPPQLLSVAPMMDYTDVHYRQLARLMSRNTWLYTEMVVDQTILHNPDHDRFLAFPPEQHPISCQLGGSNPETLAKAARIVARYGYDEINHNCGCPSDRVAGAGCFGAAMMLTPELVAACCKAMEDAVAEGPVENWNGANGANGASASSCRPPEITVKCRIGVDDEDSYDAMHRFVSVVSENSVVRNFIIHARKCLLNGLSPQQNRTVPPLRYEWLLALKRDFPHLKFSLNGGVLTLDEAVASMEADPRGTRSDSVATTNDSNSDENLRDIYGVMIGRAAYNQPWHVLSAADTDVFGAETNPARNRKEVLYAYASYADAQIGSQCVKPDGHKVPSLRVMTKPILGMFSNEPRGKKWRAAIDQELRVCETLTEVLDKTLGVLPQDVLMREPRAGAVVREGSAWGRLVPSLGRALPAVGAGDKAGTVSAR